MSNPQTFTPELRNGFPEDSNFPIFVGSNDSATGYEVNPNITAELRKEFPTVTRAIYGPDVDAAGTLARAAQPVVEMPPMWFRDP